MVTKEEIQNALRFLRSSKWNESLVELNLIRDIMIKPEQVSITFVLSEVLHPSVKVQVTQDITNAIKALGVPDVHLRFRNITSFEREDMEQRTHSKGKQQAISTAPIIPNKDDLPLNKRTDVQFLAIASGKGGVGKSTVTVNLAVALARRGKSVGIIDADIYGFSIPDMMGITEKPKVLGNTIFPVKSHGVKVVSMGFFVEDNSPVIWRGPMLGKMLGNFFTDISWGEVDIILLDLPPGTGDIALDVHQLLPQSKEIIVTTPHPTAALVATRAGTMAVQTNHEVVGIIENMAYLECPNCDTRNYVFGRGGGAALSEALQAPLLAQIPLGAPMGDSSELNHTPSIYSEESATGQLYLRIADQLLS